MRLDLRFVVPWAGELRLTEATPEELRAIRFWEETGDDRAIGRLIDARYTTKHQGVGRNG
jgi:hypothetical protein